MKPLTREWVEKAEGDFVTAHREYRARKSPNYDAACFHAQQCAEKYLKARLQEADLQFGRTHNLTALLDLLLSIEPAWEILRPHLRALTIFAVEVRYPGESADKAEAREALAFCREVRQYVRLSLELDSQ
jgi:HEPN domain-containing protein